MLHTSRSVPAPPAAVLRLLRDTASWPSWGPSVRGVEGVVGLVDEGDRGRVVTPVGVRLPFRITALRDDGPDGGAWAWAVLGVPATTHEVRPHPRRVGTSVVTFGVPTVAAPYLAVCAVALRRIERLVTTDGDA